MPVSISNVIDISVEVNSASTISTKFNLGAIIGSTVSQVLNAETRTKQYTRLAYATQMVADGYTTKSPEYIAAGHYFAQEPYTSAVVIGYMDSSETLEAALSACRDYNRDFYGVVFAMPEEFDWTSASEVTGAARAAESYDTPTMLFIRAESDAIAGALYDAAYNRTVTILTSDDATVTAAMGLFSAFNTLDRNSAYTMAFKTLVGATAIDIDDAAYAEVKAQHTNAYLRMGNQYTLLMPGVCCSGRHIDVQFLRDAVKSVLSETTMGALVRSRRIAQTESGMSEIISAIAGVCDTFADAGFIAAGIWTLDPVLNLNTGDAVTGGYYIEAEPLASQSDEDRIARITPPIYVALKGAGAIESIVIRVNINQ